MDEFVYLDQIDTAIIQFFKESDREMTVSEVYETLMDKGFDLSRKRVRNRLNSLVNYSYLESNMENGMSGGHYLRFSLKRVTT